jgi:hypothetical protein
MVRWWLVFNDIFSWSDGRSLGARHQLEIADLPKAFPAPGNQNWILTIFPGSCESCGSHSPSLPRSATGSSRSYHIGWGFDGSPLIISRNLSLLIVCVLFEINFHTGFPPRKPAEHPTLEDAAFARGRTAALLHFSCFTDLYRVSLADVNWINWSLSNSTDPDKSRTLGKPSIDSLCDPKAPRPNELTLYTSVLGRNASHPKKYALGLVLNSL